MSLAGETSITSKHYHALEQTIFSIVIWLEIVYFVSLDGLVQYVIVHL